MQLLMVTITGVMQEGMTALHIAAEDGKAEMVDCLLAHGCNVDSIDSVGAPLTYCRHHCSLSQDVQAQWVRKFWWWWARIVCHDVLMVMDGTRPVRMLW
jgi:Ankyrin repeat